MKHSRDQFVLSIYLTSTLKIVSEVRPQCMMDLSHHENSCSDTLPTFPLR